MTYIHTATYSPEDNKLRLYPGERLSEADYHRARRLGFKWAPRQELFVAPAWSPDREDFCTDLAGEIEAESMSLAERAAAKAERLDALASKRERESSAFADAARRISERFAFGQPILVGHHSERRARRDQSRMHDAMDKAVKAHNAVAYWTSRAQGAERHAARKNQAGVRARRIKTLLAELRSLQRSVNHCHDALALWQQIDAMPDGPAYVDKVRFWAGARGKSGSFTPYQHGGGSLWSELEAGDISPQQVVTICIDHFADAINAHSTKRWMEHTLNRLDYERAELGPVERYEGPISPAILQTFARTHGADSPKASATDGGFLLASSVPLPAHLAAGCSLTLSEGEWRDLMVSVGYEVPEKAARVGRAIIPLLNLDVAAIAYATLSRRHSFGVTRMTKAEYGALGKDYSGVRVAACGGFRFRTAMIRVTTSESATGLRMVAVFLTDAKAHDVPASDAIRCHSMEGAVNE